MSAVGLQNKEQVLQQLQAGNEDAFRQLFDFLFRPLCFFARKITGNAEDAEDAVSIAFARVWDRHADFDSFTAVQSFLYTTVRNHCFNLLKHQGVVSQAAKLLQLQQPEQDNYFEAKLLQAELLQIVITEIKNLPERQRLILEWSYWEDLSANEIGERLGLTPAHVRMEKSRAMAQLRTILRDKKLFGLFLLLFSGFRSESSSFDIFLK